ncbi:hypothetical protein MANY_41360 [Mycolicibacterium anyangense]|uniref:Acyl-CoA synthetase n=2 Tax=Mycolicibacterium anyangense TaxID=1431246 RepID=A0A6N4WCP3_9MYCO|nr:acyl-CoA synthetase [Mycolicibacterium anyangense]BBZ78799.1 hypothetical protein MANY_41360 [Mycolicibacterium anyangense]
MASDNESTTVPAREKLDEDDHDLLTYGEAGERLRLEIAAAERHIASLEQTGSPTEVQKARARLAALRAATTRNSVHTINDENFEKFFGYPGKAKRNLPNADRT